MLVLKGLTPIQKQYYFDDHRFTIVAAGRRSRKTLISMSKLLRRALKASITTKGLRYFHGAPVTMQAKAIFWDKLKKNTRPFWTKRPSESELTVFLINDCNIRVVGLDKSERIEGQKWDGIHITEMASMRPNAWAENIRPILSDTGGFAILDSVPEARNFYYDMALYASGGVIPTTLSDSGAYAESIDKQWAFYSWHSASVLDPEELEAVKQELDARVFKQEYEGDFITFEGSAYYNFTEANIRSVQYNKYERVHIGVDFNVNPMTAVMGHVRGDEFHQFGELYLNNSNTFELKQNIIELFNPNNVTIYPDATGKALESNAKQSDLAIFRDSPNQLEVFAHRSNPRVIDRLNTMNMMFCNALGRRRYFVDPSCKRTINDFNRVERLSDGRENKKQEEEGLVHISSAAGYLTSFLFGLRQNSVEVAQ